MLEGRYKVERLQEYLVRPIRYLGTKDVVLRGFLQVNLQGRVRPIVLCRRNLQSVLADRAVVRRANPSFQAAVIAIAIRRFSTERFLRYLSL